MAVGRPQPKRRSLADSPAHRTGVLGALLTILGILLVLLLVTRRDQEPVQSGVRSDHATAPRPDAADTANAGETLDVPASESTTREPSPDERPSLGFGDPAATQRRRERQSNDVPAGSSDLAAEHARRLASGATDDRPLHHRRTRLAPAGGTPAGDVPPGQPGVVAGEVASQRDALGTPEAQPAGHAGGQRAAAAPPPTPPDVPESQAEPEYNTLSETDAGEQKGLTGAGGAISFWLQPAWDATNEDAASLVRIGDDRLRISKSGTYLRFEIMNADGQPTALGMPIAEWNPGEWHQVVTTWDGHVISFFADGRLVGQNAYEGQIELPPNPRLYVGTNAPEAPAAPGFVTDVNVQRRPLTPDAVSHRFEQSKPPPAPPPPRR